MSAVVAGIAVPILIDVAKKIGAPFVKSVLEKHLGGAAGDIAGTVIDAIAGKAGALPADLPSLPTAELEKAVRSVEAESPALILAHVEQQRLTNELLRAEMDKDGPTWTWAWRPGGMWLLGFFWLLYVCIYPMLNLMLRLFGASEELHTIVDVGMLLTISGGFLTLYMGGHTVLKGVEKWKAPS